MNGELLKETFPEFSSNDRLIQAMLDASIIKTYTRGSVIIDYGDYLDFVPLVFKGLLKIIRQVEDGQELLLYYLNSGSSCASSFSCCMTKKRSEIKAICEEDSTVLAIPLELANTWMAEYAEWRDFIINMYDSRLIALIDTVDRIAFSQLDEKLLHYLTEMSSLKYNDILKISHQEIANDLNASRESISRLLKKLESKGIIALNRNEITILTK